MKKDLVGDSYRRRPTGFPVSRDFALTIKCNNTRCPFNDRVMRGCSGPCTVTINEGGVCELWIKAKEKGL